MNTRVMIVLASALLFAGCVGAGSLGALVAMVMLGLAACSDSASVDTCDGEMMSRCEAGRWVPVCCPKNVACNYYFSKPCGDTCISYTEECDPPADASDSDSSDVSDVDACDGTFEDGCVEGQIVALCCPTGSACNYGELLVDCGDGSCVESPTACP